MGDQVVFIIRQDTGVVVPVGQLAGTVKNEGTVVVIEVDLVIQTSHENIVGPLFRLLSLEGGLIHYLSSITVFVKAHEIQLQLLVGCRLEKEVASKRIVL